VHCVSRTFSTALAIALLTTALVHAQAGSTAQISGTVHDDSGGALPGVDVTMVQADTGVSRSTVTDATGTYVLPNLPVGPYRLRASLSGFKTFEQTGIVLQVGATPVVNVTLAVGAVNETVSVQAATPLVDTTKSSIGQVIENDRIEALPLNGRNPVELITLTGAAVPQPQLNATSRSMPGGLAISVAGGTAFGIAYVLDGATHNNPYDNLNLPFPFPDALQEFRVETSATSASNGMHSSASVNVVTKAGTNTFHGDAFEFLRDHRFNATNRFNSIDPATGKRRDDGLNRNQFGGTFGGPIKTDRLFFFGAYQGTRLRERPADLFAFVPTPAMLAGDFTAVASAQCNTIGNLTLRGPFVGNRVDPASFSQAALRIAAHLPAADDACGRVAYTRSRPQDEAQYIAKIDAQLSGNHSVFGRYMETTFTQTPPLQLEPDNLLVSTQGGRDNVARSLTLGDTLVLSNSTVNSLRVSVNYTDIHRTHEPLGFSAPDVGINVFSYLEKYMLLNVTGGFNLGGGTESEARFKTPSYQVNDDFTMIRGEHQFAVGANLAYWTSLSRANVRSPGQFTINGATTGLGLADFLLGFVSEYTQAVPNTLDMQQWYAGIYAQDTWKLSPNITLNYGVRWEPAIAQQIRNGAIYNFSLDRFLAGQKSTVFANAPAGFLYPGDAGFVNGNAGMQSHWNQWAPRAGIAWDPRGDGRSSVRAGYGLGYDYVNAQFHLNTSVAWPWGAEVRFNQASLDDPFKGSGQPNIFPFALGPTSQFALFGPYIAIPPDIATPRQQSWNVGYQRQVGTGLALEATYLGSYSDRMWNVLSLNPGVYMPGSCTLQTPTGPQFFPTCTTTGSLNFRRQLALQNFDLGKYLGPVDLHTALADQRYDGMLLRVTRRSATGMSVDANYTLSKCTGLPTQGGTTPNVNSGYLDPTNIEYDRGPCTEDRRHLFNLSAAIGTPDFANTAFRALASGWRLSGIFRAYSGNRMTVIVTGDPAGTGIGIGLGAPGQRANLVGGVDPYGDKTFNNYLNPAAFTQPAPGTLGTETRNALVGPVVKNVDLSLVRLFRLGNRQQIEARIEAFNAFNWFRPSPVTPVNVNLSSSQTFGRITSADDPRVMQFALKYAF
jgi:hypothetical protein